MGIHHFAFDLFSHLSACVCNTEFFCNTRSLVQGKPLTELLLGVLNYKLIRVLGNPFLAEL